MTPPAVPKAVPAKTESPARAQQHAALLQEALAPPGVREAKRAYNGWWQVEQVLVAYRETTREKSITIATDHTNFDPSGDRG